jgi:hypothetical protein
LLKKINLGEWLSSLFLVKDVPGGRPDAPARKSNLIAMPPVVCRIRKTKPPAAEQSCQDAMLRSL